MVVFVEDEGRECIEAKMSLLVQDWRGTSSFGRSIDPPRSCIVLTGYYTHATDRIT